jgi:hypothetical protein
VQPYVRPSPAEATSIYEISHGTYSFTVDLPLIGSAAAVANNNKYRKNVQFSLSDVKLSEIPLESNQHLENELLNRKDCRDAVSKLVETGYVCQGQELLEATGVYQFETTNGDDFKDKAELGLADESVLKKAVEAKAQVALQTEGGHWRTGTSLKYGVVMDPFCLSPPHARFARMLPKDKFGIIANYIKFNLIEWIFPKT